MDTDLVRVLLIEDDPDDVLLLKESIAEARSVRIKLAHSGTLSDGSKLLAEQEFDVILLDLNLPDSRGLDTLNSLLQKVPTLPIVVISGLADDLTTLEAVKLGAQDYLVKNEISASMLIRVLRNAIWCKREQMLIRQRADDLALINALNLAIIRGDDLQNIILFLLQELRRSFNCIGGFVAFPDPDQEYLHIQKLEFPSHLSDQIEKLVGASLSSLMLRIPMKGDGYVARLLQAGTPQVTSDADTIINYMAEFTENKLFKRLIFPSSKILGFRSAMLIPLVSGKKVYGLLELADAEEFTNADLDRVKVISGVLTAAIERMKMEEAIRASEVRNRTLLNAIPDLFFRYDRHGTYVDFKAEGTKNLFVPPEKFLNKKVTEVLPREVAEPFLASIHAALETDQLQILEYQLTIDNKPRIFEARFISNGADEVYAIIRDITENKQMEKALAESEKSYRTLFENIPVGLYRSTPVGQIVEANAAMIEMFGFPDKESLLAMNAKDLYADPNQRDEINRITEKNKTDSNFETEYRRRDGSTFWAQDNFHLIADEKGNTLFYEGSLTDITARMLMERELVERTRLLEALFTNSLTCFVLLDRDFNFIRVNEAYARAGGREVSEFPGHNHFEFYPSDARAIFEEVVRTKKPFQVSARPFIYADHPEWGVTYWDWTLVPILDKTGEVEFLVFSLNDVSERKLAEASLLESEEKFKTLFNSANDAIFTMNHTTFLDCNSTTEKIFRCTKDQIIGHSPVDFSPERQPDGRLSSQSAVEKIEAAFAGKPQFFEWRHTHQDGTPFEAEVSLNRVLIGSEFILQAIVRDVTERKQGEMAVREQAERFRTMLSTITEGFWLVDEKGRLLDVNDAYCQMSAYSKEELLTLSVSDLETVETREETARHIQTIIETGSDLFESRHKTKDGRVFDVEISAVFWTTRRQFFVFIQDISNRKQAEEQIHTQLETMKALYHLSRTFSEMEDFKSILDELTRQAVEITHVTFARVLIIENGNLVARAVFPTRLLDHDLQMEQHERLDAHPLCQHILEEKIPRVFQRDNPETAECASFFLGIAQTLCIVPLCTQRGSLGLLMLGEARNAVREPFTPEKMDLARNIADQAANTLHRALLHEETLHRLQNIQALRDIDQAIAGSFDLNLTLSILLKHVVNRLGMDAADVLLFNQHTQTLECASSYGFRSNAIRRTQLHLGQGHAGRAALERKQVIVHDLRNHVDEFVRADLLAEEDFESYYCNPLITKGQVKGVVECYMRSNRKLGNEELELLDTLAGQATIAIDNTHLFDGMQRLNVDLTLAYDTTLEGWAKALELRDQETEGHTRRVTQMTVDLARKFGSSNENIVQVRRGALLHDIGKMGVPDTILLKPGALTDEEWVIMRRHPQFAFELLSPIHFLRTALDIPYCHHEKWDGSGYPRGLKGEQIPLAARIFTVVDVFDALTSDRPYRKAWSKEKTLTHIQEQSGKHFDPKVVELFLHMKNAQT